MPRLRTRWRNRLAVQYLRDRCVRIAFEILVEDAPDRRRCCFVDFDSVPDDPAVLVALRRAPITHRETASGKARQCSAFKSAARLVGELIEVHVAEQRLDGERDLGIFAGCVDAIRDTYQGDVQVPQFAKQMTSIGQVSCNARHILNDDRINAARSLPNQLHQLLEAVANEACTTLRGVRKNELACDFTAALLNVRAAAPNLVVD